MTKRPEKADLDQGQIAGIFSQLDGNSLQDLLEERAKRAALSLGLELLEQEVEALCGARYSRTGTHSRYGSETTSILIGGARYRVSRPRIRGEEGEVYPETLAKLREPDLLDEEIKRRMLRGVSSRNYDEVIEGYSDKIGVSKSSVSRAFTRVTAKDLDSINSGDLSEHSFIALVIDGIEIGGTVVVAALGITDEMEKIPVGLKEGSTENAQVVTDLLSLLMDRGFSYETGRILCILDGGKALRKAVKSVFGTKALIQRCWLHKLRNIKAYLPKGSHPQLVTRMRRLMAVNSLANAKKEYNLLKVWLKSISCEAAASLDEAGVELLTLHALGVTGELRKSLSTTNSIESLFSVVRTKIQGVKNWKSRKTNQKLRWCAAAIVQHKENGMRKIRGMRSKGALIDALNQKLDNFSLAA